MRTLNLGLGLAAALGLLACRSDKERVLAAERIPKPTIVEVTPSAEAEPPAERAEVQEDPLEFYRNEPDDAPAPTFTAPPANPRSPTPPAAAQQSTQPPQETPEEEQPLEEATSEEAAPAESAPTEAEASPTPQAPAEQAPREETTIIVVNPPLFVPLPAPTTTPPAQGPNPPPRQPQPRPPATGRTPVPGRQPVR